jgi:hypothetical protein
MVVGFTTTYAISVYDYYKRVEFESRSWQCVLDTSSHLIKQLLTFDIG